MEDKRRICELFADVLKLTRAGSEIDMIQYQKTADGIEKAHIYFSNDEVMSVNVTCDSGMSMIRDITRALL